MLCSKTSNHFFKFKLRYLLLFFPRLPKSGLNTVDPVKTGSSLFLPVQTIKSLAYENLLYLIWFRYEILLVGVIKPYSITQSNILKIVKLSKTTLGYRNGSQKTLSLLDVLPATPPKYYDRACYFK